jgi:RNA recognition motif-containing protein
VATKTLKMRGQAFVVFKDMGAASAAVHKLSGFPFFDKPIVRAKRAKGF